ncbi:MAG: gliding motility protein GldN [Flavobacteriaceae bacterium]|nr:gliding motility protein GldN [Flavobacteriaceae bacterium]MCY4267409.1 gliding motility protein GldN [Flavobacteriaceae bacterium]MCY4298671.1 gliding motility protein GldN [Flavobacteriaceae bacterium]
MKSSTHAFLIMFMIVCGLSLSFSQYNEISAPFPSLIGQPINQNINLGKGENYIPYPFVDEKDIVWKKTIWEIIDLKQKTNLPFYFPTINNGYLSANRISLFRALLDGIESGEITEIYRTSNFNERLTLEEVRQNLFLKKLSDLGITKTNAGEPLTEDDFDIYEIQSDKILQYWIKGVWYFSKKIGSLQYQMIGMAPVAPDVTTLDDPNNQGINISEDTLVPLFWVWYKDARKVLAQNKVYTGNHLARLHSFDDYLVSRKFHSVIYAEDNLYDNRAIRDYIPENAIQQLFEAERIKESIRNFELDIWGQ